MSAGAPDIASGPSFRPIEVGGMVVERRFRGGEADVDALVEALYSLLLDSPGEQSDVRESSAQNAEKTCLLEPSRVRNVF